MADKALKSSSGAASPLPNVPGAGTTTTSLFSFDPAHLAAAGAITPGSALANHIVPTPTQPLPFAAFGLNAAKPAGGPTAAEVLGAPTALGLPPGGSPAPFSPWSSSPNSASPAIPLRSAVNLSLGADLLPAGLASPRTPNTLLTALSEAPTPLLSEAASAAAFSRPAPVAAAAATHSVVAAAAAPGASPRAAEIEDTDDDAAPAGASRRKRTASGTFKATTVTPAAAAPAAPAAPTTPAALAAIASQHAHAAVTSSTSTAVGVVDDDDDDEEDEESDTPGAADALTQFASHANGSSLIPIGSAYSLVPAAPGMALQDPNLSDHEEGGQAQYIDITHYLNMPQSQAAKKLGIPTSTLSKRWKEAVRNRKWPHRAISKLDKEIMTLLHNIPQNGDNAPLPSDIEATLGHLLRRRQEELKPVRIRIN